MASSPPPPAFTNDTQPPPSSTPPPTTSASAPPPAEVAAPSSNPPPSGSPDVPPPPASSSSSAASTPPANPVPSQPQTLMPRPPLSVSRPQAPFSHFSHNLPSSSSSSSSSSASPSSHPMSSSGQRGGIAIGVPAHHTRPHQSSQPLFGSSPPFSQAFGGFPRANASVPEQPNTQPRQPVQGIQTIGMIGSLSSGSQLRPSTPTAQHQQRLGQTTPRSITPSANQNINNQKFQNHGLLRGPSVASGSAPSPGMQSPQTLQQQWLSNQGKQMHASPSPSPSPSSSYRPQNRQQVAQHRPSHPQQPQHPLQTTSNQQLLSSQQQQQQQQVKQNQQASLPHQSQEQYNQQYLPSRNPQSLAQQQLAARSQVAAPQISNVPTPMLSSAVLSGGTNQVLTADVAGTGNQVLSKRSIHELITQIDPSEILNPEVEDVLVEITDEFIESIVTFGCSLAKHRKSTTLEGKDIILHAERNWNMALPGVSGDEIKIYKKPFLNDIHKERLAVIKKSMIGIGEAGNAKNSAAGQSAANSKAHLAKQPLIGSPKT